MADDKDVLGKVDALMRRHGVAAPTTGSDTGSVPILTDFVEPPGEAQPPPAVPADDFSARVAAEVQARLAAEIERRVADQLAPHLRDAVRQAVAQMRGEIVRLVNEAVAQAIERRHVK